MSHSQHTLKNGLSEPWSTAPTLARKDVMRNPTLDSILEYDKFSAIREKECENLEFEMATNNFLTTFINLDPENPEADMIFIPPLSTPERSLR